jgi:hypothetical protein
MHTVVRLTAHFRCLIDLGASSSPPPPSSFAVVAVVAVVVVQVWNS